MSYQGSAPFCSECDTKRLQASTHQNYINYIKARMRDMHNRAKKKEHEVSDELDVEFLLGIYQEQQGLCAISGLPLTWGYEGQEHANSGDRRGTNISIDRIDSSRGYVPGNVRLVCDRVNRIKSNMDDTDLYFWCCQISATMRKI